MSAVSAHGRPRTSIRRTLHGRRIEVTKGTLFDVLMLSAANLWQPEFTLVAPGGKGAQCAVPVHAPNGLLRQGATSPIITISTPLSTESSWTLGYNILRLFRARGPKSRKRAARQETPYRGETFDRAWPQCARYRLRLWRDGELSGAVLRRECNGVTLSQTQLGVARSGAVEFGLSGQPISGLAITVPRRALRPHRFGWHVRTCRPCHYDMFFWKVAQLLDEDGIALIHTIGRADGP